jgi:O-methyltransferase involved in polyketide biosynthesis
MDLQRAGRAHTELARQRDDHWRLFPQRDGAQTVAASLDDPHLLDGIAGDTPVLVIAEGLTPYLRAVDGLALLRRITEHFPDGTCCSTVTVGLACRFCSATAA